MTITEIAPDVFRLSVFAKEINLQFNHFLVRDEQPILYHTGTRRMFPQVFAGVKQLMDPSKLRWIGYSHLKWTSVVRSMSGWPMRRTRKP
jgi:flavorubredoxin